jgi:hypothetical protein
MVSVALGFKPHAVDDHDIGMHLPDELQHL